MMPSQRNYQILTKAIVCLIILIFAMMMTPALIRIGKTQPIAPPSVALPSNAGSPAVGNETDQPRIRVVSDDSRENPVDEPAPPIRKSRSIAEPVFE